MLLTFRFQRDPDLLARMDPDFWHPEYDRAPERCRLPLVEMGQFVREITYGPIVTGPHPQDEPGNLAILSQGQVTATGVDLRAAHRVAPGSAWDRPRARVAVGDLLIPRSGDGAVARNRLTVVLEPCDAVVGSFVNRVALEVLDPAYAALCLRTEVVWLQVHRLINGVGTPNISFDEIRGLRIPWLPESGNGSTQASFAGRYRQSVHAAHLKWLGGDDSARETARRNLRVLLAEIDRLTWGSGPAGTPGHAGGV
jgi:hypothetical protein